jgi:hypothetical protein
LQWECFAIANESRIAFQLLRGKSDYRVLAVIFASGDRDCLAGGAGDGQQTGKEKQSGFHPPCVRQIWKFVNILSSCSVISRLRNCGASDACFHGLSRAVPIFIDTARTKNIVEVNSTNLTANPVTLTGTDASEFSLAQRSLRTLR